MPNELKTTRADFATATAGFRSRIADLNLRGTRIAAFLAALMVPSFSLLDYFVMRPRFEFLLGVRLSVCAVCVFLMLATRASWARRAATVLSAAVMIVVGLSIAMMIHVHDALDPGNSPSHYYAGLILVIVGAAQLCMWTLRESIAVYGIVYLSYLAPTIIVQFPADGIMYLSNNFFLVSTIIIATAGQYFGYQLQLREFLASSELGAANSELESANVRLKELDRFKSQFFSNITHELKTPLTLILAPTEALMKGELGQFSADQQEYFRRIFSNGLKLMKLINDLLDLARIEDSKLKLRVEEVDGVEFVGAIVADIRPLAERKGIALSLMSPERRVVLWGDRDRLEQVLVNLLANAVKFTPEGGRIDVILDETEEDVRIAVADSGIGIPPEKLELVFDRFSQVDGTTTRKYGGTGIGLALARELTQLHGGRIWAESDGQTGTTMRLVLPRGSGHFAPGVLDRRTRQVGVAKGRRSDDSGIPQWSARIEERKDYRYLAVDEASERRLAPRDDSAGPKRGRILLVEDTREMLQFIQLQLREHYTVYLAENGRKGWELVCKLLPDLVITDYMMPEMDGLELTSLIKGGRETSQIPVVMLTAKTATDDRVAGREAGADEYLAKPFSTAELLAVVKGLIRQREESADRLAEQRMDSLEVLAARLAHEIQNPLNYMKNGAALIQRTMERLLEPVMASGGVREAKDLARLDALLQQIMVGAERIGKTVELLKQYAREGYERVESAYDVDEGISAALGMVRPMDGSERRIVYEPAGAGAVMCVPQELHEIVLNLVQNAIDATGEEGEVRVTALRDAGTVVLSVLDNGQGMDRETMEKVFSPFFTTKGPGRGMGMGLTIVYRLAKRLGGRVDVSSEPGKGSCFTVRLPAVKAPGTSAGGSA